MSIHFHERHISSRIYFFQEGKNNKLEKLIDQMDLVNLGPHYVSAFISESHAKSFE